MRDGLAAAEAAAAAAAAAGEQKLTSCARNSRPWKTCKQGEHVTFGGKAKVCQCASGRRTLFLGTKL